MFARALAPHDGTVFFRAFVYDHLTLNETDWHADRANAAVDFFEGLDTEFDHNVVVQIKHGPIALVEEGVPVVVLAPRHALQAKLVNNVQEVRARGARTIVIATDGDESVTPYADQVIKIPDTKSLLTPLLMLVPMQVLSAEIARALLTSESTVGQRISRAKKSLATAGATFELPTGQERTDRLDDVMAVVYLIFNEGYTATVGEAWMRPDLANEAMRLARMLAALAPDEPEVLGLQALLEIQGSRMPARLDEGGTPVLLEAQDRTRWDQLLIRRGMAALQQAERLAARGKPVGKYFLQASIAAEHARAERADTTNWRRIATLYDVLADAAPGPVVEVNRAVAHGRAFGPDAGLAVPVAVFLARVHQRNGRAAEASEALRRVDNPATIHQLLERGWARGRRRRVTGGADRKAGRGAGCNDWTHTIRILRASAGRAVHDAR